MCYGCGNPFAKRMEKPPHDLILKRFDYREYRNRTTGELVKSYRLENTYYHLDMSCVRRRYPYTQVDDILVYKEFELTDAHTEKLRKFGIHVE